MNAIPETSSCSLACLIVGLTTQPVEEAQVGGLKEAAIPFLICLRCWAADKPESFPRPTSEAATELRVTVKVYNGMHLPLDELSRAQHEASRIFRYAGIQLTWADGLLGSDISDATPSETWSPPSLQLRIWPRAASGKRPSGADTMGFCLSLESGDAVVLADAVREHVVLGGPTFADLLGLAMAHEVGHLLLRSAAHSVTGIMRSRWTPKRLRDDDRGFLRFTAGEAESMRNEVRRRMDLVSVP